MENALIVVPTMRLFAGIDMLSDRISDENTIAAVLTPAGEAPPRRADS
jgi:hypothetical protein